MFARATFPSPESNGKNNHTQTPGTPEAAFGFPRTLRSEFFTVNQLLIDNSQSAPATFRKTCWPTANVKVPSVLEKQTGTLTLRGAKSCYNKLP